mmetsp:Transcript_13774/g.29087  ORF Transcript_13774/g.29087 Transcript_13774/m.29087 type:complete len:202 (+) Transcript_13774:889-1494(+)
MVHAADITSHHQRRHGLLLRNHHGEKVHYSPLHALESQQNMGRLHRRRNIHNHHWLVSLAISRTIHLDDMPHQPIGILPPKIGMRSRKHLPRGDHLLPASGLRTPSKSGGTFAPSRHCRNMHPSRPFHRRDDHRRRVHRTQPPSPPRTRLPPRTLRLRLSPPTPSPLPTGSHHHPHPTSRHLPLSLRLPRRAIWWIPRIGH